MPLLQALVDDEGENTEWNEVSRINFFVLGNIKDNEKVIFNKCARENMLIEESFGLLFECFVIL